MFMVLYLKTPKNKSCYLMFKIFTDFCKKRGANCKYVKRPGILLPGQYDFNMCMNYVYAAAAASSGC